MSKANSTVGGPSCRTCPSFIVPGARQHDLLGLSVNAPVCGLKMIPLVSPKQDKPTQDRVLSHRAKSCDKFGMEIRDSRLEPTDLPLLEVGFELDSPDPTLSTIPSCGTCVNFVSAVQVSDEYGWTAPMCRATGSLMLSDRLANYAAKCGKFSRRFGPTPRRNQLGTFQIFPEFGAAFGHMDLLASYRQRVSSAADPLTHKTDREVRPAHTARGITSWRKVSDPDGYGADVFLPIYSRELFTEAERELIPTTGSAEHPELYADHGGLTYGMAVLWMKLDETPAWWGQGGTGKTEFARYLAWLMAAPFHRINVTASTEIDDIAGKMTFEEGETRFHYGRLPQFWQRPGVILLDEPNTGPPEVWQLIRPLTDNSRMLVLDQHKSERIPRHSDCYFALAMNPSWDVRNVGAQTIGDADSSRMMHMFFDFPPSALEMEIIQRRVALDGWQVPDDSLRDLMRVAEELRTAGSEGVLHSTWGLRHQIKVARALRYFKPVVAYRRAVGDALEPSQMEMVIQIVHSFFGE